MFNRYWREFPWFLQAILFILMIMIFLGLATIIAHLLIPSLTGIEMPDIPNVTGIPTANQLNALLLLQFLTSAFIFLVPPLLFANVTHPKPAQYLGLRKPANAVQVILSVILMIGALPIFLSLSGWLSQFDFGNAAQEAQEKNDKLTQVLLTMPGFGAFLKALIVLAVLPAIGEELFFRGMLMRLSAKRIRPVLPSILITAVLFAYFHGNVYGWPAIFIAGTLLGSIYYLTSSLWCSIVTHMVYNGFQVVLFYLFKDDAAVKAAVDTNVLPWYLPVTGAVVFALAFLLLWKYRTPLPANWADDFAGEKPETPDNFTV